MSERQSAEQKLLDVGCGRDKLPGAIGIDAIAFAGVDVVHDLDRFPWPFDDDTFDRVRAQDVLEHVADFVGCMAEIHRICRNGAELEVRMPFMTSVHFFTDPTHRRAGTSRTFDYFDPERELGEYGYSKSRFKVLGFHYERGYPNTPLGRTLKRLDRRLIPWLERNSIAYEHFFAGVYPMHNVSYRLCVVKSG